MYAKVGDHPNDIYLSCFSDADFAGCPYTLRSTSGVFMKITGPSTHFPISGLSQKQTAVSHSTTEAEIIAAALAIRKEGVPNLLTLEFILGRSQSDSLMLEFLEDNQTSMRVLSTGKNPTLRYMGRTHNTDMAWVFERFQHRQIKLRYCKTHEQAADIFTKHFVLEDKWKLACHLIGHMTYEDFICPIGKRPNFVPDKKGKADPSDYLPKYDDSYFSQSPAKTKKPKARGPAGIQHMYKKLKS